MYRGFVSHLFEIMLLPPLGISLIELADLKYPFDGLGDFDIICAINACLLSFVVMLMRLEHAMPPFADVLIAVTTPPQMKNHDAYSAAFLQFTTLWFATMSFIG